MNYLKKFYESSEFDSFFRFFGINYVLRPDGLYDTTRSVILEPTIFSDKNYNKIKQLPIKFGHVKGSFECKLNRITSMTGFPEVVDYNFTCKGTKITSLDGAPRFVGGSFDVSDNSNLYDPYGIRDVQIGEYFFCDSTPIKPIYKMFYEAAKSPEFVRDIWDMVPRRNNLILGFDAFQQSLDYNYIKGKTINIKLFDEMCDHYGLTETTVRKKKDLVRRIQYYYNFV